MRWSEVEGVRWKEGKTTLSASAVVSNKGS
jgi:hypothetical protein